MRSAALKALGALAIGGLTLALEAAFFGNVIRVRAQYAPKEENPDSEDNREVMGVSFVRMLKRVIRLEGWRGLFRGIVLLISIALAFFVLFRLTDAGKAFETIHPVLRTILAYVLVVLFDVPFAVFFVRSIAIAELLPFCNFRRGIDALLSPSERRQPWLLYLTPGLLLVIALERAWEVILVPVLIKLISRHIPDVHLMTYVINHDVSTQAIAKFGLVVVNTLLLTPLQVVTVRLAVQRREEQAIVLGDSVDIPSERVTEGEALLATGKAPVVRLRTQTEQPAYTGLFNCIASIVAEEGCDTLYRVWWFTFLVSLVRVSVKGPFGR